MQTVSDEIDFLQFLGKQESQWLVEPSSLTDEVLARFSGEASIAGDLLPWSKTHEYVSLRPGEVSILGGFNGHGKSQILGQVCAWNLHKKWLIASMEMKPSATMQRMTRQVSGSANPDPDYVRRFMKWTDGRLWIYDQNDTVKADRILGMVHYAAQELGINHVIIDSLMKCGFRGSRDQVSGQQVAFVDRLCWAAKSENIHIHLVHHMRKGEGNKGEYIPPGKHDFRGAAELVDLVDNAFVIHRNKSKEDKKEPDPDEPDCTLRIVKQRHGEKEGVFNLWFHPESQQYTPSQRNQPIPFREAT